MTALVTRAGQFDHAAIMARRSELFDDKREFISRYSGRPRQRWQSRILAETSRAAWREAHAEREALIFETIQQHCQPSAMLFPKERRKIEFLEASQRACPINQNGNEDFRRISGAAAILREKGARRARKRAIKLLQARDPAQPMLQAAE